MLKLEKDINTNTTGWVDMMETTDGNNLTNE